MDLEQEELAKFALSQLITLAAQLDVLLDEVDKATNARDAIVYQLMVVGVPNHRIAQATGLSHGRVSQITKSQSEYRKAQEVAATLQDLKKDLSAVPRPESR